MRGKRRNHDAQSSDHEERHVGWVKLINKERL